MPYHPASYSVQKMYPQELSQVTEHKPALTLMLISILTRLVLISVEPSTLKSVLLSLFPFGKDPIRIFM